MRIVSRKKSISMIIFAVLALLVIVMPYAFEPLLFNFDLFPLIGAGAYGEVVSAGIAGLISAIAGVEAATEIASVLSTYITPYFNYAIYAFLGIALLTLIFSIILAATRNNGFRKFCKVMGIIFGILFIIFSIVFVATFAGMIAVAATSGDFFTTLGDLVVSGGFISVLYFLVISVTGSVKFFMGYNKNKKYLKQAKK